MNTMKKTKNILYRKFFVSEIKKIYKDRFDKVYFIDYENLEKWIFLKIIFNLAVIKRNLKSKFSNIRHNPSFKSKYTSNLTLLFTIFLKYQLICSILNF